MCTPEELFVWTRLPFGVRNGPPAFQRAMQQALGEAGLGDKAGCFIDDVATGGANHRQGVKNLRDLFAALEAKHLLAGADKVELGLEVVNFLGYQLKEGNLHPDPEKTAAIDRLAPPRTRTEVRGFLGLTGYYRDFVRGYSSIAKPLTELLKEDHIWEWTPACSQAFKRLKEALTSEPILALPEPDRPYVVHTDFSHHAVSAVLEQQKSDGKYHIIAYASRTCTDAEAKLGPTDGELLAILYAVEKFHGYIGGTKFLLVTDHSALQYLNSAKNTNAKLARWAARLASYDFSIKHRAGRVHNNADGLSRSRTHMTPDTPAEGTTAIDAAAVPDATLLVAALEAMYGDASIDGDIGLPSSFEVVPQLGPR